MNGLRGTVGSGVLLLAVSALGCGAGGDGGGPAPGPPETCAMVPPCGGDITGNWKVLGGCTDGLFASGLLTCPGNPQLLAGLGYSGTLAFNADMTYTTTNFVERGTATYTIPNSCLPGGVTCAGLNRGCSGTSDCTCSTMGFGNFLGGSGTYHVSGNEVIFTFPDGTETGDIYYCVQGDVLHLETWITLIQSDGTRTTPVTSDVVAQKQ